MYCDLLTIGTWGDTPPPLRHADVFNGWSLWHKILRTLGPIQIYEIFHSFGSIYKMPTYLQTSIVTDLCLLWGPFIMSSWSAFWEPLETNFITSLLLVGRKSTWQRALPLRALHLFLPLFWRIFEFRRALKYPWAYQITLKIPHILIMRIESHTWDIQISLRRKETAELMQLNIKKAPPYHHIAGP